MIAKDEWGRRWEGFPLLQGELRRVLVMFLKSPLKYYPQSRGEREGRGDALRRTGNSKGGSQPRERGLLGNPDRRLVFHATVEEKREYNQEQASGSYSADGWVL